MDRKHFGQIGFHILYFLYFLSLASPTPTLSFPTHACPSPHPCAVKAGKDPWPSGLTSVHAQVRPVTARGT